MNNSEYWEKRLTEIRDTAAKTKKIKNIYRKAYRNTEVDLKKLYDEFINTGELTASELYRSRRFLSLLEEIKNKTQILKAV